MKLSPLILILKKAVLAWDGPWDGVNVLTDDVLQSNDLMELNRDPKLTFIGRVKKVIERRGQILAVRTSDAEGKKIHSFKISRAMDILKKQ